MNLRLALAIFGLVFLAGLTVVLFSLGQPVPAVIALVFAVGALVDIVIVQIRRRQRRRADPRRHSLFE